MPTTNAFEGFDFDGFWDDAEFSLESYVEPAPGDELVASVEKELGGFRLPSAYVELARVQNGGLVRRNCHPMDEPTGWAEDHIAITGLYAIGRTSTYSLCGKTGSRFWEQEWEYPRIGVYFADTPTAGHEMIALDYRECGKRGEPRVVYVDQEDDYRITVVAPDFATFIKGLVSEEQYDTSEADRQKAEYKVEHGTISPILLRALEAAGGDLPDGERMLRRLARLIVEKKGHFSLHADEHSHLMYGMIFWLVAESNGAIEIFGPEIDLIVVGHDADIELGLCCAQTPKALDQIANCKCTHDPDVQNFPWSLARNGAHHPVDLRKRATNDGIERSAFIG